MASAHLGTVLIAGLEPRRAGAVAKALGERGLIATLVFDTAQLEEFLRREPFDLVAVDLGGLTDTAALEGLRQALEHTEAQVLGLADNDDGRGTTPARARIPANATAEDIAEAAVSLVDNRRGGAHGVLRWGPLGLDVPRRQARWASRPVLLTKLQFRLLAALAMAKGAVVSQEELSQALYGSEASVEVDGERVAAHARRIRLKIEEDPANPRYLLTIRGEGFRLSDGAQDSSFERYAS
jgi:DNA-binding response OmpR family regulator